jgi:MFS family permease
MLLAQRFIAAGCIVVFLGQFFASFSHSLWSIFLTQVSTKFLRKCRCSYAKLITKGIMQGLGCGLLLPMIFAIPSQWFRKHRGVATGIVVAGSSLGGAVPSLVVHVRENSPKITFR